MILIAPFTGFGQVFTATDNNQQNRKGNTMSEATKQSAEQLIDLKWTNPDGTIDVVQVDQLQLKRMLKAAVTPEEEKQEVRKVSNQNSESDFAEQLMQLQQLQLQQMKGIKLTEIQKCQLDPDRMKLWAIGLPIGGAIVGGLFAAFGMSLSRNDD